MADLVVHVSRADLVDFLRRELPAMLSGRRPDTYGIGRACLLAAVVEALRLVYEDFTQKSLGNAGADGIAWEPLSEYTLEQRSSKRSGRAGQPGAGPQHLSPEEAESLRSRRREIYRREYARLRQGGLSSKEARRQAAIIAKALTRSAWEARARAFRARGLPGVPGAAPGDFPILDDTGRLKASVAPGSLSGLGLEAEYVPPEHPLAMAGDQEIVFGAGEAEVVSNVPYGGQHMAPGYGSTTGGYRPARPWKYGEDIPESWRWSIRRAYAEALERLVPLAVARWAASRAT